MARPLSDGQRHSRGYRQFLEIGSWRRQDPRARLALDSGSCRLPSFSGGPEPCLTRRLGGLIRPAVTLAAASPVSHVPRPREGRGSRGPRILPGPINSGRLGWRPDLGLEGDPLAADRVPRPSGECGRGPGGDQRVRNVYGGGRCRAMPAAMASPGATRSRRGSSRSGRSPRTKKACGPAETAVETAFLAVMGNVADVFDQRRLARAEECRSQGRPQVRCDRSGRPVEDRWVATGGNDGAGARSSVVIDTTITAIFDEAGSVTGSGGCNDYNGP